LEKQSNPSADPSVWVISVAVRTNQVTLRKRVCEAIDAEVRDSLRVAVHGKAGQPGPRCGSTVSEVKRQHIAAHFRRTCQPGLMVDRRHRPSGL